jgi:transposase
MLKEFPNGDCIFQQDNCSVHTAHLIRDYLQREGIRTLPWPAKSPDLNIIENLWFMLKYEIKKNIELIKNLQDLKKVIRDCWAGIKGSYIKTLYDSIPRRLRAVQVHKGHLTKY